MDWMVWMVECPLQKLCCPSDSPATSSIAFRIQGCYSFSKSFPTVSSVHSGLYDDREFPQPSPFLINTRWAVFLCKLKILCFMHWLYMSSSRLGHTLTVTLSISDGMLSGPSTFLFLSGGMAQWTSFSEKSGASLSGSPSSSRSILSEHIGNSVSLFPPLLPYPWWKTAEFLHYDLVAKVPGIIVDLFHCSLPFQGLALLDGHLEGFPCR